MFVLSRTQPRIQRVKLMTTNSVVPQPMDSPVWAKRKSNLPPNGRSRRPQRVPMETPSNGTAGQQSLTTTETPTCGTIRGRDQRQGPKGRGSVVRNK